MNTEVLGFLGTALAAILVMGTTLTVLLQWIRGLVAEKLSELKDQVADYKRERDFWKDEAVKTKEELRENAKRNADNQEASTRAIKAIEGLLIDVAGKGGKDG